LFSAAADSVSLDAAVAATRSHLEQLETAGFDECIAYWPAQPGTYAPLPEQEAVLERVAADVLPRLRANGPKT